ncbi:hypothetical protein QBC34DRAFT_436122 [Podospora aff. communis PSN243]|uniref:Uncharacterized protein n=1 Tax=Podospora aff. communis PSN243 TaxID=3040156 RepID=A0AAV9GU44_9PEZI|nr:hypothetical protein QBC34DRAFT_436122 [Podospora aff. communis PSN243]
MGYQAPKNYPPWPWAIPALAPRAPVVDRAAASAISAASAAAGVPAAGVPVGGSASASAPASGAAGAPLDAATSPVSPQLPPLSLENLERHNLASRRLCREEDVKRARSGQTAAERLPRPGRTIAGTSDRLWGEQRHVEGRHQFYPSEKFKLWAVDSAFSVARELRGRTFSPIFSQAGSDAPTGTKRPSDVASSEMDPSKRRRLGIEMKRALWKRIHGLKDKGEARANDPTAVDDDKDRVPVFKHSRDDIGDDDLRSYIRGKTPSEANRWMQGRYEMVAEIRRLKVRLGLNSDKSSPKEDSKSSPVLASNDAKERGTTTSKGTKGKGKGFEITSRSTKEADNEVAQALSRLSMLDPASHAPPSFDPVEKKIKVCLLGDSGAGKTALLNVLTNSLQPIDQLEPSTTADCRTFPNAVGNTNRIVQVELYDLPGTSTRQRPHRLVTNFFHVAVICYSIEDEANVQAVTRTWKPLLDNCLVECPVFVLGLKADLRKDHPTVQLGFDPKPNPVTKEMGENAARGAGAVAWGECSSLVPSTIARAWGEILGEVVARLDRGEYDLALASGRGSSRRRLGTGLRNVAEMLRRNGRRFPTSE